MRRKVNVTSCKRKLTCKRRTKFLLIGLKNKLVKIGLHNILLDTCHSARDLGFVFDKQRNRTGPPCSVGHPSAHAPGAGPPSGSVKDDDR